MGWPSNRQLVGLLVATALAGACALVPSAAAAARGPGALDPSFGKGGRVVARTVQEVADSEFSAAAREPDGNLVLVLTHASTRPELVREVEMRTPAGALVPSFGEGGRVTVEAGSAVATLPDGDILLGGAKCDGNPGSVLMLDPTGAKVAGFGDDGCGAAVGFSVTQISVDAQGRILVGGTTSAACPDCSKGQGPPREAVIARLLPNGSLDTGFGNGGEVAAEIDLHLAGEGGLGGVEFKGLAAAPEGKVTLSVGQGLVRLDENGTLDTGYGSGGVARTKGYAGALAVAPDGSALVVDSAFDVSRFGPSGALDPGFGNGGTAELPLPPESELSQIAVEPDGGILLAGQEGAPKGKNPYLTTPFLERLTATGRPDPTYGEGGVTKLNLTNTDKPGPINLWALLQTPSGSAIVVGNDRGQSAAAVALTSTGSPDPSFAAAGTLVEEVTRPAQLEPTGLALMPRGKLKVESRRSALRGVLSGYLTTFGPGGRQLATPGGAPAVETLSHGPLVPITGERVAIVGSDEVQRHYLRGTGPGGGTVRGYGTKGIALLPFHLKMEAVVQAPGGGALVIGRSEGAMAAYRLGPGGRPVRGFGHRGLAKVAFPSVSATADAALVEADGDIVLTGSVGKQLGVVRLLPDGRLDRSFGRGGVVRGLLGRGASGEAVAPFQGGLVIAAGVEHEAAGLVRLDSRGRLVRTFGHRGVLRKGPANSALAIFAAAGRIVVVNNPEGEEGHHGSGVELRAYKADGKVARGFGRRGVAFYGGGESPRLVPVAAVQQSDGKIVVVGTASKFGTGETGAVLLRFLVR